VKQDAGAIGPGEGQGEQAKEFAEAFGVGQVGVLEVEAPALQATEQGLDLPAVGVGFNGLGLGRAGTGDEQELPVVQAERGEVDETPPDRAMAREVLTFAGFERGKQPVEASHLVTPVGREGVTLEALIEGDVVLLEPAEPRFTDKLAVVQK